METEVLLAMTGAGAGLLGTGVGALISWYSTDRRSKIQTTIDLHREWHCDEMTSVRMVADRFVRLHSGKQLLQLELEEEPREYANLLRVLNFFLRISLLLKYNQIAKKLVPELFGTYIVWWGINCFDAGIPAKWVFRDDWTFLRAWLEQEATHQTMARWRENAVNARNNRQIDQRGIDVSNEATSGGE